MQFSQISKQAIKIKKQYDLLEKKLYGRKWNNLELMMGFVGDVGQLSKIIMVKEGVRTIENVDQKLKHELADCLWSVLVLADRYKIDLEKAFLEMVDLTEKKINKN